MSERFLPDAMLLAAGLGRRMLPLTESRPKPLIEVAGMSLIERVIANAWAEGVLRFTVNTHHFSEQVEAEVRQLQRRYAGTQFRLSPEPETLLDTGGGVRKALPLLQTDPILVMNADVFWPRGADAPIARMEELFAYKTSDIVLLCAQPHRATGMRRSHDFCLAPDAAITNDYGQPVIYAGVALIRRGMFDTTPDGPFSLLRLFEDALERQTLHGVVLDAPWFHIGDPAAIGEAEALLLASA